MRVRDRPHIKNRPPRIVSAQTSRGDTIMRKFILIAGFALVSVAAHAGDRGLSLGGGEATKVSAPARADGQRTAEAPQAAEAPKYVERPAVVEPKPETTRSETIRSENEQGLGGQRRADAAAAGRHAAGLRRSSPGRRSRRGVGPPSGDDAEAGGSAAGALRHQGTHHQRAAPSRHLLLICQSKTRLSDSHPKARFRLRRPEPTNGVPPILTASPSAPRC